MIVTRICIGGPMNGRIYSYEVEDENDLGYDLQFHTADFVYWVGPAGIAVHTYKPIRFTDTNSDGSPGVDVIILVHESLKETDCMNFAEFREQILCELANKRNKESIKDESN